MKNQTTESFMVIGTIDGLAKSFKLLDALEDPGVVITGLPLEEEELMLENMVGDDGVEKMHPGAT